MDGIELLYLLFVGVYFLLGMRRRQNAAKQKAAQASGDAPMVGKKAPTPFQEFMTQMEQSIREANGEPPVEREAVIEVPPTPEARPSPMPVPTSRPLVSARAREPEFHSAGGFDFDSGFDRSRHASHDEHGFGLNQPFSEERFEQLARGRDVTVHAHPPLARRRRQPTDARTSRWATMLQSPKAAQDAFVFAQIFQGPWRPKRVKRIGHQ